MTQFTMFKRYVKQLQGFWTSENVYFSQKRDTYSAAYLPKYPEKSEEDTYIEFDGCMYQFRTANGVVAECFETYNALQRFMFQAYARYAAYTNVSSVKCLATESDEAHALFLMLQGKYYKICCEQGFAKMQQIAQNDVQEYKKKSKTVYKNLNNKSSC